MTTYKTELEISKEWEPERMEPGTLFILENAGEVGEKNNPYWAILSCPSCGTLGLITLRQITGVNPVVCGSDRCPVFFHLHNHDFGLSVVPHKPY